MDKLVIYTDGACKKNGSKTAIGGIGVFWGDGHANNISSRVCLLAVTNNICELLAIDAAVEGILAESAPKGLEYTIASDSKYAISSLTTWYAGFVARGWRTVSGTPIKNKALIASIKAKLDVLGNRVSFKYVKAHAGNAGNEAADFLATSACV